jgi:pyroglutamyl-peptidase
LNTKVLLTGFEPFAGSSLNPSQEIVNEIAKLNIPGIEIITAILPVVFGESSEKLLKLIAAEKPDVVILLGQAEGRTQITPERVAINLDDARIADNSGAILIDRPIVNGGPAAYFSTLPVKEIVAAISANGIAAAPSLSAGTFVCNHIFYSLQHALFNANIKSGFIHVPLMTEQAGEFPNLFTMPLSEMVKGITAAISVACSK